MFTGSDAVKRRSHVRAEAEHAAREGVRRVKPDGFGASNGSARDTATAGARVREARKRQGLTLRAVARSLGVSPAAMSQFETGKTRLSIVKLGEIADVLGTSVSDILAISLEHARGTRTETARRRMAGIPGGEIHVGEVISPAGTHDWRTYAPLNFDPVLAAALDEFVRVGYFGASVRNIAQRCGLSVAGLYHYYPSKQEMLRKILHLTMSDLLWRAQAARGQGHDPAERFALLIECLALFHTRRRELAFVGASEMRGLNPENYQQIASIRTAQQRMVDEEAESAVAQGQFHTPAPHAASRAVVTMCTALAQWFHPGGSLTPEDVANQYVEFSLSLMQYAHGLNHKVYSQ